MSSVIDLLKSHKSIRKFTDQKIEPELKSNVLNIFDLKNSINSKKSFGGTSFNNIKKMIVKYKKIYK